MYESCEEALLWKGVAPFSEGYHRAPEGGFVPMARLKCSMRTAVFFTSEEYTSEPTIGQKGTFLPSSWAMPSASAVLPVPGAPVKTQSRPQHLRYQRGDAKMTLVLAWPGVKGLQAKGGQAHLQEGAPGLPSSSAGSSPL